MAHSHDTDGPSDGESSAAQPVPELLAPAGDWSALEAALGAGASAVYFGLKALNARRFARNFDQEEFARAVELVHQHGARAYLTLNIDLAERELGLAARILWWARQCGTDAVLVRDPALLVMQPEVPELEFHFSTQSCVTNSADVEAAAALGICRVVLAREMTLAEIRSASAVRNVQTEVFAQGALCFSVSGRCYLSSWAGGRSGNRGSCTSPCRVPWSAEGGAAETPFSMRDLTTLQRTGELVEAGVAALKIEGRMKNAAWVGRAVGIYRRALDGTADDAVWEEVVQLGGYTGRDLTAGYLDGQRGELTGTAGREAARESGGRATSKTAGRSDREVDSHRFNLSIQIAPGGIEFECSSGGRNEQWTLPKTVVRRKHKAVAVGPFLDWLRQYPPPGCRGDELTTNDPDYLLVPRAANGIVDRVAAVVRRGQKKTDDLIAIDLPDGLRAVLEKPAPAAANRSALGGTPNRVRLDAAAVGSFVRQWRPQSVIVEGLSESSLAKVHRAAGKTPLIVALPSVFFEDDLPSLNGLLSACKRAGLAVEVNSWAGWLLARSVGLRMEGGPGLPVLNSLAAAKWGELGLRSVTLSVEADRKKLEDLTANCPVACSLVVYGRPPLLTSRVQLSDEEFRNQVLVDRRDVRIRGRRERGLWVFRPVEPFDLRNVRNERIRVAHLVVDLVASDDPIAEFGDSGETGGRTFRFNYSRKLA